MLLFLGRAPVSQAVGRNLTPMNLTSSLHHFVDLALNVELRMFGFDTFKLDGNFFSCSNIRTLAKKENHIHYQIIQSLLQEGQALFSILYSFLRQEQCWGWNPAPLDRARPKPANEPHPSS